MPFHRKKDRKKIKDTLKRGFIAGGKLISVAAPIAGGIFGGAAGAAVGAIAGEAAGRRAAREENKFRGGTKAQQNARTRRAVATARGVGGAATAVAGVGALATGGSIFGQLGGLFGGGGEQPLAQEESPLDQEFRSLTTADLDGAGSSSLGAITDADLFGEGADNATLGGASDQSSSVLGFLNRLVAPLLGTGVDVTESGGQNTDVPKMPGRKSPAATGRGRAQTPVQKAILPIGLLGLAFFLR